MKALTLSQPWATLVAIGAKRIETRSWPTKYRGPLAIHAAKSGPDVARDAFPDRGRFIDALKAGGADPWNLPRGAIVATCRLVGCFKISRSATYQLVTGERIEILEPEESFGDYTPGRYGWLLADVKPLPKAIPARGALGLWTWEP